MKRIRAAAKVSQSARLKALGGGNANPMPMAEPQVNSRSPAAPSVMPLGGGAQSSGGSGMPMPMQGVKRGGAVKKRANGGGVTTAGAGGGLGRLQKIGNVK